MVLNASKALKNETNEETRQAKIAAICMLFVPIFFLEWGGETHAFCKVLRTKPRWFSGKIVGLIGLVGLVEFAG